MRAPIHHGAFVRPETMLKLLGHGKQMKWENVDLDALLAKHGLLTMFAVEASCCNDAPCCHLLAYMHRNGLASMLSGSWLQESGKQPMAWHLVQTSLTSHMSSQI